MVTPSNQVNYEADSYAHGTQSAVANEAVFYHFGSSVSSSTHQIIYSRNFTSDENHQTSPSYSSWTSSNPASDKGTGDASQALNASSQSAPSSPTESISKNDTNSRNSSNELPQTGESNDRNIALALMALSAEIGELGFGLTEKRKRKNN